MRNIEAEKIRRAFWDISNKSEEDKDRFLFVLSKIIKQREKEIVASNKKDVQATRKSRLAEAFIQRLVLNSTGIEKIIAKVLAVRKLKSGIGEVIEEKIREDGLKLQKKRVAIGTILIIYEARPEVTIDIACLCIKSGNVAILKGGSEALQTNRILYKCIFEALKKTRISQETITFIDSSDRSIINNLIRRNDFIDLVIARGGYRMVRDIQNNSSIPVLSHSSGGARIYIDKSADLSIMESIIVNSKITKPSACNSLDTVLIHREIKDSIYSRLVDRLKKCRVTIVDNVWDQEFLGLKMSIKIVDSLDEAIDFVNTYGKKHSEGIIAADKKAIDRFIRSVDAAAIFVNSSTRLHDGYEFGLGSEMGIATGKLHARGPVGLKELTIYKWITYGKGHIRK